MVDTILAHLLSRCVLRKIEEELKKAGISFE